MTYDSRPDTYEHIDKVRYHLHAVISELLERAYLHDATKLQSPEVEMFDELTPKLKGLKYGSPEYKAATDAMGPALQHHYEHNPHHPEHHPDGIRGMTLIDLVEMLCDWKAAGERTKDGDIHTSINQNRERFGVDPQLHDILHNTAVALWGDD
jgi:uncharacterized protein DUF5662